MDRDAVAAGVLDAPQVQHLRAAGRHLEHLLVGDAVEPPGGRHDARVGGVDAVDVGVDLADVGLERGRERDGGRVGPAAAERGDVLRVLETPWKPATMAMAPSPRASAMRPGVTSMMRALPWRQSVMTPAWLPVKDRASWPRS